jgi:hypothetical protein
MTTLRLPAFLAACALAAFLHQAPISARAAAACELDNVARIVAVGDVHGAYDRLLEILRTAEVINAEGKWTGGATHLVQTGDVLDRGPDSLKAMEYLRRLTREAERAGGRVHALIGNHEVMRLLEDYRYVHPGEYDAFKTANSQDLRQRLADQAAPADRARILAFPLGMIEMAQAFKPEENYGGYLRSLNTTVRINGIVFVHGGISPPVAKMNCQAINDAVRREIGRDYDKTRRTPEPTLAAGENGPLWYRGLALEPEGFAPQVDAILAAQKARAIVVGHSVAAGTIGTRFNGKVYTIDTGMQSAYVPEGKPAALEIKGAVITAIYLDRREILAGREVIASGTHRPQ